MGRTTAVSVVNRRALNQALLYAQNAPPHALRGPGVWVRALRSALRMSLAHLSRRSGVSKPQIVRLELGRGSSNLRTIERLFDAMFCDALVLPRARKRPSDALAERELVRLVGQGPWIDPSPLDAARRDTMASRIR